jgi:pimeloyl-ACP methyl ester carboxylesterase
VIIYFHGNGEIAPDYDYSAGEYRRAGASLLVIDYRGYGWSTGRPLASTLLSDAEQAADVLPDILDAVGYGTAPLFLMGRSLGSAPAIHLAHRNEDRYRGLIIESGFSMMIPLLARLGLVVPQISGAPDPLGNLDKMREIGLPLLVIHGENDQLIPVSNGQALYDASPADLKRIKRIPYAGHNDLQMVAVDEYFAAIGDFLRDALR